jgi:hypothetical protein
MEMNKISLYLSPPKNRNSISSFIVMGIYKGKYSYAFYSQKKAASRMCNDANIEGGETKQQNF